jgi:cell division protein FtsL
MATIPELEARIQKIKEEIQSADRIIETQTRLLANSNLSVNQRRTAQRLLQTAQTLQQQKTRELAEIENQISRLQNIPAASRDSAGTRVVATNPEVSRPRTAQTLTAAQEQNLRQLSAVGPGDDDSSERSATPAPVNPATSAGDGVVTPSTAGGSIRTTDPALVGSGEQGKNPESQGKIPSNNILHDYSNYTYQLSWHLMTITDYNNLVKDPNSRYVPKNVLVASAGKYNTEFVRSAAWKEDFYFESLEMQTVIGLNARTRGTNAIELTFKLIEPYGVSLLERLLKAADTVESSVSGSETATPVTAKNYTQLPYMLQIDFLGYNDKGLPTLIPGATKYIPINVLSIEFSVTNRGSEYTIRAVPFNHQAFKTTRATVPANFEISPRTVGDFFKGENVVDQEAFLATRQENQNKYDQAVKTFREAQIGAREEGIDFSKVQDLYYTDVINAENKLKTYAVAGIEGALNNYYEFEKIRATGASITIAPQYQFIIDPDIAKAKINKNKVEPKNTTVSSRTAGNVTTQADYQRSQKTQKDQPAPGIPVDANTELYRINAGTSIIELINTVIRNSEYIIDQVNKEKTSATSTERDQKTARQENTDPIMWFKIVPSIEILGYDTKVNSYALRMTYEVSKYPISGRNIPGAPQNQVRENQISRIYNYIYTGRNQDILDLNIEFNTQYFMAITASPDKFSSTSASTPEETQNSPTREIETDQTYIPGIHVLSSNQQTPQAVYTNPDAVLAADIAANLMNTGPDMMTIKLKIIGDPAWIKQDDIFSSGNRQQMLTQEATGGSSILTDPAEVYVRLNFQTPTDIDDQKGIYKFDNLKYSLFSGIYRVLTVTNRFERGQFTQDLELVRILNQPAANTPRKSPNERALTPGSPGAQSVSTVSVPTSSSQPRPDTAVPEQIQLRRNLPSLSPTDIDNSPDPIQLPSTVPTRAITETTISPSSSQIPSRIQELNREIQQLTSSIERQNTFINNPNVSVIQRRSAERIRAGIEQILAQKRSALETLTART